MIGGRVGDADSRRRAKALRRGLRLRVPPPRIEESALHPSRAKRRAMERREAARIVD